MIDASDYSQITRVQFVFLTPDKEFFAELFANKNLAAAIAYTIIKDNQLEQLEEDIEKHDAKTDEEYQMLFVRRLNGPALRDMHRALLESVADFFPEMQTALSSLLKQMDKVNERLRTEVEQMDNQLSYYIETEMDKLLKEEKEKLSKLSGNQLGVGSTSP